MNINEYGSFLNLSSEPEIISVVSKIDYSVNYNRILLSGTNFEEITVYPEKSSKAVIRIKKGHKMSTENYKNLLNEWENASSPKKSLPIRNIRVRFRKDCTVIFYKTYLDVYGDVNWARNYILDNGWATETLLGKPIQVKSLNGKFSLGKRVNLERFSRMAGLALDREHYTVLFGIKEKRGKGRAKMLEAGNRGGEIFNGNSNENIGEPLGPQKEYVKRKVPAVVIKYNQTIQGTRYKITYQVFSSGKVLFSMAGGGSPADIKKLFMQILYGINYFFANENVVERENRHAERYPLARMIPRTGEFSYKIGKESFTVKPPRGFYIRPGTNGKPRLYKYLNMKFNPEVGWTGNKKLTLTQKNATIVAKAFANAKVAIPNHTRQIFKNEFGLNLELPSNNKPAYANTSNRRAPSWNATKPGFFVRPGPGRQPYWAKIPAGIKAGQTSVIKRYTEAGINIPRAVRNIFKIGNNVKTEGTRTHNVTIGNNDILRINGRQVTRLTMPELVAIAHNLGVPQVNSKTNKKEIIKFIKQKKGLVGRQEAREVAAKAKAKEKAVAKKEAKEAAKAAKENQKTKNVELVYMKKLKNALGKKYQNGDTNKFMNVYRRLPSGSRGHPLKANVEKAFKNFIANINALRVQPGKLALTQKQQNILKRLQQKQFVGAAAQVQRM